MATQDDVLALIDELKRRLEKDREVHALPSVAMQILPHEEGCDGQSLWLDTLGEWSLRHGQTGGDVNDGLDSLLGFVAIIVEGVDEDDEIEYVGQHWDRLLDVFSGLLRRACDKLQ